MEKFKRHALIIILLIFAGILLCAPGANHNQQFYGVVALLWALPSIRRSLAEERFIKKIKNTDWYKKYKE